MPLKPKFILFAVLGTIFIAWLIWYLVNFLHIQRQTMLATASTALNCPREQIDTGHTQQFSENGPTEVVVKGCGKSARLECTDYVSTRSILAQYFSFDIKCIEKR